MVFKKIASTVALLFLITPLSSKSEPICGGTLNPLNKYEDEAKGKVVIFEKPSSATKADLTCALGNEFIKTASNVPDIMTIGITNPHRDSLTVAQWKITENVFLLITLELNENLQVGTGVFIVYPSPLERVMDLLIQREFPDLTSHPKYKSNKVKATKEQILNLVGGTP